MGAILSVTTWIQVAKLSGPRARWFELPRAGNLGFGSSKGGVAQDDFGAESEIQRKFVFYFLIYGFYF
jgi:hypothetical protein